MKVNFEYIAQKKAEKTKLLSKKVYSYGSDLSLIRAKSLAGLMKNLQPVRHNNTVKQITTKPNDLKE